MPDPGTIIEGKYEILATIRESETGALYKVRHLHLDDIRIVKAMRRQGASSDELGRRFLQEAKTLTRLRHPNICSILDFFQDAQGTAYIVLEYIDGVNVSELLEASGTPSLPFALDITHQTLLALECLHRRNIVHRDISPDNIMLTMDENLEPHVKLIGLGVAKMLTSTAEITASGNLVGKMKYSSPEQLGALEEGEKLDGRSDLYSLGVVLYQMLTGILPIQGDRPRQILVGHLFLPPLPFTKSDPEGKVPQEIAVMVFKALEKRRLLRFGSAEDFDREVLSLKGRLARPADAETTSPMTIGEAWRAPSSFIPVLRAVSEALKRDSATPPVEPAPLGETPIAAEPTPLVKPAAPVTTAGAPVTPPESSPPPSSWKRQRFRLAIGGTAAIGSLIGVLVLSLFIRSKPDTRSRAPAPPTMPPVAAAAALNPEPVARPPAEPAGSAATEVPTPAPEPLMPAVEEARSRMAAARLAAEAEEAPARTPKTYQRARQKENEALGLFGRRDFVLAGEAFAAAEELFWKARKSGALSRRDAEKRRLQAKLTPTAPVLAAREPRPEPEPVPTAAAIILVSPVLVTEVGPKYPGSDTLPPGPAEIVIAVEAVVTEMGEVRDAQVQNDQHLVLDRAAINAVSNWHFRPATVNGKPVAVRIKVTSVVRRTKNLLGNRLKEVSRKAETLGLADPVASQAAQ